MHELSIAKNIVEIATEHARDNLADRILSIKLRIGTLTCVHKSALEFSFEAVAEGTMLEGARLDFVDVPAVVFCGPCGVEVELASIQSFRCPNCQAACGDLRQGQELEIESIEINTQMTESSQV